jgi:hypothetical protein
MQAVAVLLPFRVSIKQNVEAWRRVAQMGEAPAGGFSRAVDYALANLADGHISKTGQHGLDRQSVLPVHFLEQSAFSGQLSAIGFSDRLPLGYNGWWQMPSRFPDTPADC